MGGGAGSRPAGGGMGGGAGSRPAGGMGGQGGGGGRGAGGAPAGKGAIIALDVNTGNVKWRWDGEGPAYDSPAIMTIDGNKVVVDLTERSLVGLNLADGKSLFMAPAVGAGMNGHNDSSPVIDGQTIIYSGAGRGTRAVRISKSGDTYNVAELWSNPDLGTQFSTPVLKDGYLYGLSDKSSLFCMNAANGKQAWLDTAKRGQRGFGSIVDAGSVLLALGGNELTVFKPDPAQFSSVAQIKVSDSPLYSYPVVSGNRIYVRDADSVALLTVE